ncbi:serine/threonine-protein kinase [Nocardia sp. NPDC059239]|uniref:serine/threonine-protein kinase n=1 Tax=unclassified Nocardia TaxID=2637762 RepID=UPI0036AC76F3
MSQSPAGSRVGTTFGHYQLKRLLGLGGVGDVYEAYDTVKDRTVALELVSGDLAADSRYREQFRRESRLAARLQEPHIVPIHDFGEIDGLLYIDRRLVRGDDLGTLIARHGPMDAVTAVAVVGQVAAALDAAHADGLIHGDVEPANILVGDDDFAYLVDFGIGRSVARSGSTDRDTRAGVSGNEAPEVLQDNEITGRADIYSLACVLHECLTGTRPYSSGSAEAGISDDLFEPIPRPSVVHPGTPAAFDRTARFRTPVSTAFSDRSPSTPSAGWTACRRASTTSTSCAVTTTT